MKSVWWATGRSNLADRRLTATKTSRLARNSGFGRVLEALFFEEYTSLSRSFRTHAKLAKLAGSWARDKNSESCAKNRFKQLSVGTGLRSLRSPLLYYITFSIVPLKAVLCIKYWATKINWLFDNDLFIIFSHKLKHRKSVINTSLWSLYIHQKC